MGAVAGKKEGEKAYQLIIHIVVENCSKDLKVRLRYTAEGWGGIVTWKLL